MKALTDNEKAKLSQVLGEWRDSEAFATADPKTGIGPDGTYGDGKRPEGPCHLLVTDSTPLHDGRLAVGRCRGTIKLQGRHLSPHQAAWALASGDVPPTKEQGVIRHLCGHGHLHCFNPDHLLLGSEKQNGADRVIHGTSLRMLTVEQEAELRKRHEAGESVNSLKQEFGTSSKTVENAIRRAGGRVRTRKEASNLRSVFDKQQSDELRRRYEAGESVNSLRKEFGVGGATVASAIRRAGGKVLDAASSRQIGRTFTAEQGFELRRRYEAGESTVALAREFGVSVVPVTGAIKRAGGCMRSFQDAQANRHGRSSLTPEQDAEALRLHESGWYSMADLVARFNVGSKMAIHGAIRRARKAA